MAIKTKNLEKYGFKQGPYNYYVIYNSEEEEVIKFAHVRISSASVTIEAIDSNTLSIYYTEAPSEEVYLISSKVDYILKENATAIVSPSSEGIKIRVKTEDNTILYVNREKVGELHLEMHGKSSALIASASKAEVTMYDSSYCTIHMSYGYQNNIAEATLNLYDDSSIDINSSKTSDSKGFIYVNSYDDAFLRVDKAIEHKTEINLYDNSKIV